MIGRLAGTLLDKTPPSLLLDVAGVGYEVEAPMTTFFDLPAQGEALTLFIHHVVREDASLLYGFLHESDRMLFRQLIRINGVGPKMALGILSGMTADEFSLCVQASDASALTRLPGVGKKTAERLLIEMRDKLDANASAPLPGATQPAADPRQEAIAALIALGYKPADASKRISGVEAEAANTEDMIRLALKSAAQR